jgi:hypothetical protein
MIPLPPESVRAVATRLGPVEQRDGVWGGVGWVRKVEQ